MTSDANFASQIFGSFDWDNREYVETSGRATTRPADSGNSRIESHSPDLISAHVQEGNGAAEVEAVSEQDPELWDQDEDEAEGMEGFEETHAPGGRRWR